MISFYKSVTCDDIGMLANSLTRVFGSIGFVHNFSPCLDKLSFVSQMYFLGYPWSQKGYKCYSHSLCHYLISADITFFSSPFSSPFFFFSYLSFCNIFCWCKPSPLSFFVLHAFENGEHCNSFQHSWYVNPLQQSQH